MNDLIAELTLKVIDVLNLQDISPEDFDPDEQLVGGRFGIDSIDVLELVIMMEKDYGIVIDNKELGAKVFATLGTMAAYIADQAGPPSA